MSIILILLLPATYTIEQPLSASHSLKQFFQQAVGNGALDNQIKQIMIEQNLKRQHNFISDMKKQMVKLERNFNHD